MRLLNLAALVATLFTVTAQAASTAELEAVLPKCAVRIELFKFSSQRTNC